MVTLRRKLSRESEEDGASCFDSLPAKIKLLIFNFLPFAARIRIRLVCKLWRDVLKASFVINERTAMVFEPSSCNCPLCSQKIPTGTLTVWQDVVETAIRAMIGVERKRYFSVEQICHYISSHWFKLWNQIRKLTCRHSLTLQFPISNKKGRKIRLPRCFRASFVRLLWNSLLKLSSRQ